MRALTLKPHWAHAVAHMGKRAVGRAVWVDTREAREGEEQS